LISSDFNHHFFLNPALGELNLSEPDLKSPGKIEIIRCELV